MLVASLTLVGLLGARALTCQSPVGPAPVSPTEALFGRLHAAVERADYRLVQVRRVRGYFQGLGRGGEWVGAVESLLHRGVGASVDEGFSLDLLGFENTILSPAQLAHRQRVYQGQASFLVRYQSFRVFDPKLAALGYSVHFVGQVTRAQRACLRLTVVARTADRPSWLIDVDVATDYPLYCAEFTPRGELVAELEVLRADFGAAARVPSGDAWTWSPRVGVVEPATVDEAFVRMRPAQVLAPAATSVGTGYALERARVLTDPLTAQSTLTLIYTDGIDAAFVSQTAKAPIVDAGHVAQVFTDAGITQCRFQHKSTEFLIIGRHAQVREVAKLIYAQAVAAF